MNRVVFGLLIMAASAAGCHHKKNEVAETVSRFRWLNGSWHMKEGNGMITEYWKTVNDSLMEGSSGFIEGDSTTPFENTRLFRRKDAFYYEAKAAGQNNEQPVEFKLTSYTDSGFVAENPMHDFPRRITYKLVNKDSIHAFVDGGPAVPDKRSDFFYSRNKN